MIMIVLPEPLNAQRIQFDVVKYRKKSQTAASNRNVLGLLRVGRRVTIPFAGAVKLQLEVVKAAFQCTFGKDVIGTPVLIPSHSC
jgi:hypothetical protein